MTGVRDQFDEPGPISISESLERMRHWLGTSTPSAVSTLEDSWAQLVGARLAEACALGSIRSGTLVVTSADPAVAEHLRWMSAELVAAANEILGRDEISSVEVRVVRP